MTRFAAGRRTGVCLPASKEEYEAYQQSGCSMSVEGNGKTWFLYAAGFDEGTGLIEFTGEAMEWEAGTYHLETEIGGCTAEATIEVRDMQGIRVLVAPIRSCYSGTVRDTVEAGGTLDDFSQKVFPIGGRGLEWICYPGALDLSDKRYDLDSSIGRFRAWSRLKALQNETSAYDLMVGLVPWNMAAGKTDGAGDEGISGFTYQGPAMVVSMQGTSPAVTIAHEIGHCYGLGDEYPYGMVNPEKNMIPYQMSGMYVGNPMEILTGECIYVKGGAGDGRQGTGTLITPGQLPFDISTGEIIQREMTSYMGLADYAEPEYWMTADTWNTVYDALVLAE